LAASAPSLAPALSIVPICSVAAQGEVFGILGILHRILDLFGPAFGLRVTNLVTIFGIFPVRDIFPLRTSALKLFQDLQSFWNEDSEDIYTSSMDIVHYQASPQKTTRSDSF